MLSLFDPPDIAIQKMLSREVLPQYASVLYCLDMTYPNNDKRKAGFMRGIIGSVWAYNSVCSGKFSVTQSQWEKIRKLGEGCLKYLHMFELKDCKYMIDELMQEGIITRPTYNPLLAPTASSPFVSFIDINLPNNQFAGAYSPVNPFFKASTPQNTTSQV